MALAKSHGDRATLRDPLTRGDADFIEDPPPLRLLVTMWDTPALPKGSTQQTERNAKPQVSRGYANLSKP